MSKAHLCLFQKTCHLGNFLYKRLLTLRFLTTRHLVPRLYRNLVACQQDAHATSRFLSFRFQWGIASKFLFISFFLIGCVATPPSVSQTKIRELSLFLESLDKTIPQSEAMHLSQDIFHKTQKLTKEFELTSPPIFHNFLVTVGLREKGLCYHWSDALYDCLSQKKYVSFEFHLVGANIGEYFYEHNALVVVAKGGAVEEGIVIDPWRDSGELYFSKVEDDLTYKWKHRAARGCLP